MLFLLEEEFADLMEISGGERVQNLENKGYHINLEYVIMKWLYKNRFDSI